MFLLISEDRDAALQVCSILSASGFFVYSSPLETALFLCGEKDTGGVAVDCTAFPERAKRLCSALRRRHPSMPIAALIREGSDPSPHADFILQASLSSPDATNAIKEFFTKVCQYQPVPLSTHYLSVAPNERTVQYMGYPIRLSPREHRIPYCLLYRAPQAVSAEELCAFCGGGLTTEAIRVYVHRINRRAAKITPDAPPVVVCRRDQKFSLGI
jgi:DNA-binding response OmpR family regulator